MSNLEKYDDVFISELQVEKADLPDLEYQGIDGWDSVGHMALMTAIEDAFDIMMETDDIIDFSSYEKGKEILSSNYGIEF